MPSPSRPQEPAGESTTWYAAYWAFAARGYWQAFQRVTAAVEQVLDGGNAGEIADRVHPEWYRELFGPSVAAAILRPADLAGYRNGPVYIRRSLHVPPPMEAVRDLMPELFALLAAEPVPAVLVVRVIDESGDDYLYPQEYFVAIALPQPIRKAVLEAA